MVNKGRSYDTAIKRWEGFGPYYAMFPTRFADAVVKEYTSPGDMILDPFAGRGTAVFSSAALDRIGIGIEISPVGWIYAKVKLVPAPLEEVQARLLEIGEHTDRFAGEAEALPEFFKKCFVPSVRRFLLASRYKLDWRKNICDRTLMALLLIYLHGKRGQAFSNQMRQTKAMAPQYSIDWWSKRKMDPPEISSVAFMGKRIQWRYAKGIMEENGSEVFLDDAVNRLPSLKTWLGNRGLPQPNLLLTSPPYFGVTNYHYDQWLRLWLLGYEADASARRGPHQGRFGNAVSYQSLLQNVFHYAASVVSDDAVIYVRTSNQTFTRETTRRALLDAFPNKQLSEHIRPFIKPTQTHLFGDKTPKPGEIDLVLTPG